MDRKLISRRHFMKSSIAGMAGLICFSSNEKKQDKNQGQRKFIYRTLGKTGIKVPVIGMGMLFAGNPALMQAALDAGITHFDTTAGYLQQMRNEEMIGEVLKGRRRQSYIFGTKVHLPRNQKTGLYAGSGSSCR